MIGYFLRRSLAGQIEALSSSPVVMIGAGHGRGDPASLIYELKPETMVGVIDGDTDVTKLESKLTSDDEIWIVYAKRWRTAAVEKGLFDGLTKDRTYTIVSRAKRVAHLRKAQHPRNDR